MARLALRKDLRQVEEVAGKSGADTIRLWDGYRDQALLWRALSLIQIPVTGVALIIALVAIMTSDPIVNTVQQPLPGRYSANKLPDAIFISEAEELVNLISSYQPAVVRRQFLQAEEMLWEPALSRFQKDMLQTELRIIEETSRSQLFFVNESKKKIERFPEQDKVVVSLPGTLQKLIGTDSLPPEDVVYLISMTTVPRHEGNDYGIVVINIDTRAISFADLEE